MYQTPTFSLQDQSFAFKTFLYVFTYEWYLLISSFNTKAQQQ